MKHALRLRKALPLICLLLIAALLRFHHLSSLFNFTLDEEYWSYLPFNIASFYHLPLIGGHISGTGLYSGPLFVYLMAIPFRILAGNPLAGALTASSLGIATTFFLYRITKETVSKQAGLLTSLLYATSFLAVIYDRKYWNATPIAFLSVLTIYLLLKLKKQQKLSLLLALAFVLSLATHAHATGFIILIAALVSLAVTKPIKQKKSLAQLILFFLFFQIPLLLFELRHQFLNTKAFLALLAQAPIQSGAIFAKITEASQLILLTFSRLIYTPGSHDLYQEITLCSDLAHLRALPPLFISFIVIVVIAFALFQFKKKRLPAIFLITNLVLLFLYRLFAPAGSWYTGQLSEYYLLPSFPLFFILFAQMVAKFTRSPFKPLICLAIAVLIIINFKAGLTMKHSDGYQNKIIAARQIVAQLHEQPFALDVVGEPCRLYGYRYLFTYLNHEPVESYLDPLFNWLYHQRLSRKIRQKKVIITTKDGEIKTAIYDLSTT